MRIMFVCHGNICRSPMAEYILGDMVKARGLEKEIQVSSCATSTEEIWNGVGNDLYPPARRKLQEKGICAPKRQAVQLKKSDYTKYDLFVCMDANNVLNALRILGADPEGKVCKLLSFAADSADVADPWYTGDFERTYREVVRGCEALLAKWEKESKSSLPKR